MVAWPRFRRSRADGFGGSESVLAPDLSGSTPAIACRNRCPSDADPFFFLSMKLPILHIGDHTKYVQYHLLFWCVGFSAGRGRISI